MHLEEDVPDELDAIALVDGMGIPLALGDPDLTAPGRGGEW